MPRPRRPSTESIKKIYASLLNGPKCFEDLWKETRLHRNTLGSTLKFLLGRGLLIHHRKGHKKVYEIVKTTPPYYGWEIPWIEFMMTKGDWREKWNVVDAEIKRFQMQKKWNNLIKQFFSYLINHPKNKDLREALKETGMLDVPISIFKENLSNPFCLECLKGKKKLVKTVLCKETGELVCPSCGTVLENA